MLDVFFLNWILRRILYILVYNLGIFTLHTTEHTFHPMTNHVTQINQWETRKRAGIINAIIQEREE